MSERTQLFCVTVQPAGHDVFLIKSKQRVKRYFDEVRTIGRSIIGR